MNAVQRTILQMEREQERNFNQRQVGKLLRQFAPGFVGFSSTRHARIAGRVALGKTFQHYLQQARRVRYRVAQPRVQVFGNAAVASFYWTVTLGRRVVRGRGSHVFIKQGKQWRIVHEHFSRAH
ncbi:MAG TPA: nuclear transport factor 2 family protein [Candidatus Xenobia bacterium]|nr:nuclear transport factor 2 family protein [Candidatus Xenobia bacterium]